MKNSFIWLLCFCGLLFPVAALAQAPTFSVPHDTVLLDVSTPFVTASDNISNLTGATLKLQWQVISSNFPTCWLSENAFAICDASHCVANSGDTLWNNITGTGLPMTSDYGFGISHDTIEPFLLSLNLDSCTIGCYYVTVKVKDITFGSFGYTDTVTFEVCYEVPTRVNSVPGADQITIFPNPATSVLNVVYKGNDEARNVVISNMIGKVFSTGKLTSNSASLNLENMPPGIYFVRLLNSNGDPVVTRKFTKQ